MTTAGAPTKRPGTRVDPLIGTSVAGKYKIIKKIGEGGMGSVYIAEQEPIERKVAIKLLLSKLAEDETSVKRFEQEARTISKMQHPNTVTIYDFGQTDNDQLYIVMEFLKGKTLTSVLRSEGVLQPARACRIVRQVCASLSDAHAAGIIHRDLKPDNIFLTEVGGDPDWVKVLDFGVAKLANEGAGTLTQTGMIFGTPKYMSPEQAEGRALDYRADIYAIGVVLFELLIGRPPFIADSPMALLIKHISEPPPPFAKIRPDLQIDERLEAIVMKALAKAPDRRYSKALDLAQELEQFERMSTGAVPVATVGTGQHQPLGGSGVALPTEVNLGSVSAAMHPNQLVPPNRVPSSLSLSGMQPPASTDAQLRAALEAPSGSRPPAGGFGAPAGGTGARPAAPSAETNDLLTEAREPASRPISAGPAPSQSYIGTGTANPYGASQSSHGAAPAWPPQSQSAHGQSPWVPSQSQAQASWPPPSQSAHGGPAPSWPPPSAPSQSMLGYPPPQATYPPVPSQQIHLPGQVPSMQMPAATPESATLAGVSRVEEISGVLPAARGKKNNTPIMVGAALLLVAGIGATVVLTRGDGNSTTQMPSEAPPPGPVQQAQPTTPPPAPVTPPPVAVTPPVVPPPVVETKAPEPAGRRASNKVKVKFRSKPTGAFVEINRQALGQTPLDMELNKGDEPVSVVFRKEGYEEKSTLYLPSADNKVVMVELKRASAAAPATASPSTPEPTETPKATPVPTPPPSGQKKDPYDDRVEELKDE